jgi:kynurenine formamidase
MKILDLTHTINETMPVFPGTEPPVIKQALTLEADRNREKLITMFSHTGTHMDAPAHMIEDGNTLDQLAINHFVGPAVVIDCRNVEDKVIELGLIKQYEETIRKVDFVLFCNGWSSRWGSPNYFEEFPALSLEAAEWLSKQGLKGVGTDVISIDLLSAEVFSVHHVLLKSNMVIIENLRGLESLLNKDFTLSALPLKIEDADGSPIRAIAMY